MSNLEKRRGEVSVRAVLFSAAALAILIAVALVCCALLFVLLERRYGILPAPVRPMVSKSQPALEIYTGQTLQEVRRENAARLDRYEWIDRKSGILRIPIERAMELAARRGPSSFRARKTEEVAP